MLVNEYVAAKELGMGVQSLRNFRCQRRGPKYVKLGRTIRYNLEDLREYVCAHTITPETISRTKGGLK